ncbi:MAG: CopG family transcriptional regulator [Microlunatus sp.]|nr:CopG family transcriptional regulator [Microlunatus sp.]MDN5770171.1 CopG family transcriptional regulator [Microlunatus sp.]MDN5803609.1 CopG family transcriptional regulator [Microlunatus sp.]
MRTTIEFEADTTKAIERLRREDGRGVSEAVNELIRRGLNAPSSTPTFVQRTRPLGLKLDVSNIGEVLEVLEGPDAR